MTTTKRVVIRYSLSFKKKVIEELESGVGIATLQRRYGIRGAQTIQNWIVKFGKHHLINKIIRVETMEEKDKIKALEQQIKELKGALADSILAQRCLEVVIDEAGKEYRTDLKKNFGTGSSPGSLNASK